MNLWYFMPGMKKNSFFDIWLWKENTMEGKKGRLTQDVLRAVCIIIIILREVIDPVTASFVDSCESDSCDSAVMYKVPKSHPTHPM